MAEEVALFPSMPAPPLALLRCRWRHPHRARAAPPWNLPVLVRASGGTHGDTIFGENDTSARLASELLAQVAPPYSITSAAPLALTYVIVKVTSCRTGP